MDGSRMTETSVTDGEVVSTRTQRAEMPLYASRIKVYPKDIKGTFRRVKWAVLVLCLAAYYIAPWLRWDRGPGAPDQALLIDLPGARAYFFWIEIWPQEVYYITGLLILAAIGLFLATSLFGRVWCGLCLPADGLDRSFHVGRALIEGDRNARRKLDQQPLVRRQGRQEDRQARGVAADRGGDRRRLGHVFQRCTHGGARDRDAAGGIGRLFVLRPVHGDDLPAGRVGARAGLHLYVPLAAHPGGDAR